METAVTRGGRRATAVAFLLLVAFLAQGVRATNADAATHRRDTMLSLTNEDRAAHDKTALSLDGKLSRYAKKHSHDMARAGYPFHTEDLAAKLDGVDWSIGGENVGVGSSLDGLEDAFMHSKTHRRNVLRKVFDHSAIGVYRDGDGNFWVTVIFYG
jgi:uncharacterized protein YkwD